MIDLVIETKTSSEDITPGGTYWKRTKIDVQIDTYINAARAMGLDIRGVGYDVLRKPALRPSMATPPELRKYTKPTKAEPVPRLYANQREADETPDEFFARCLDAIVADPEAYYQRAVVVRLENESNESAADNWATAQNLVYAHRLNVFPRNPDSCIQWSRECEYLPVCCGEATLEDPFLFRKFEDTHEELNLIEADGRVRLTQSSIRTYRSCPRKYQYRYVDRMRSLVKSEPLRAGSSVHRAIEALRTGKTLEESLGVLDTENAFANAKERAMIVGYFARWGAPQGMRAVEHQFEISLVNPGTGAASRTFRLAGKFDALFQGHENQFLNPGDGR